MKTEIKTYVSDVDAECAAQVLKHGGVVVFPTETVYGLGALISRTDAVRKIYDIKGRQDNKPLSILGADTGVFLQAADEERLSSLRIRVPGTGREISGKAAVKAFAEAFCPGPLTMVLPKRPSIPDEVTSGLNTVGIRVPDHPVALAILRAAGEPVATTSANLSGQPAAVSAKEARDALEGNVDLIIDGGTSSVKTASTVIGFEEGHIAVYRQGIITLEDLNEALKRIPDIL